MRLLLQIILGFGSPFGPLGLFVILGVRTPGDQARYPWLDHSVITSSRSSLQQSVVLEDHSEPPVV